MNPVLLWTSAQPFRVDAVSLAVTPGSNCNRLLTAVTSTRINGTRCVLLSGYSFQVRRFGKLSSSERKREEMYHFVFHQSHISEKNMDRLRVLLDDSDEGVRNMAYVLIRVAEIRPHRRKRLKYLVKVDRTLAKEFVDVFLAGEWIDMEHDDYNEGLSFGAPGGG